MAAAFCPSNLMTCNWQPFNDPSVLHIYNAGMVATRAGVWQVYTSSPATGTTWPSHYASGWMVPTEGAQQRLVHMLDAAFGNARASVHCGSCSNSSNKSNGGSRSRTSSGSRPSRCRPRAHQEHRRQLWRRHP